MEGKKLHYMVSNIRAKIIAISWLFKKIGLVVTVEIFFEILVKRPREHLIRFKIYDRDIKLVIMGLRTDVAMVTEIFCFESYDIKKQTQPKLIVDGGANKGATTVYFGVRYPGVEIHCYEPNIDLIPILKKNIKLNHINAKVFNEALSDRGKLTYFEKNINHQYSKLVEENTEVRVVAISLNKRYFNRKIDILKLDIEGEEEKVISSLDFSNLEINVIIQEIHYDRVNYKKIFSLLKKNNYEFENPYSQYYYLNSKVERPILLAIRR